MNSVTLINTSLYCNVTPYTVLTMFCSVLACFVLSYLQLYYVSGLDLVYNKPGNVSITGIFNGRTGNGCRTHIGRGLEEMASTIWTVEALKHYNYLPGISIGLSIFDTCTENTTNSTSNAKYLQGDATMIGILTSEVTELPEEAKRTIIVEHFVDRQTLIVMVVQLLLNLQWMTVDFVVSDSEVVLNSFSEKTSDEGICVRDELLINDRWNGSSRLSFSSNSLIVIISDFQHMAEVLKEEEKNDGVRLLLVPTDYIYYTLPGLPKDTMVLLPSMEGNEKLLGFIKEKNGDFFNRREPTKSPLFVGIAAGIVELLKPFKQACNEMMKGRIVEEDDKRKNSKTVNFNLKQPCANAVNLIDSFIENKTVLLPRKSLKVSPDDIESTLRVLKMEPRSNDEMFLYILTSMCPVEEDLAIVDVFDWKTKTIRPLPLMINDDLVGDDGNRFGYDKLEEDFRGEEQEKPKRQNSESGASLIQLFRSLVSRSMGNLKRAAQNKDERRRPRVGNVSAEECDVRYCRNFRGNATLNGTLEYEPLILWKFLTWVSVNTSVGLIGIISTLSIMFFIICRICKGDILEGSPYFTIVLMFTVILVFCSSLPYHIELPHHRFLNCDLQFNAPPLAYAILFSLLLSRSLMLASNENRNGFVSHINGYLQTTLFLFMVAVQVSFTSQHFIYEEHSEDCCDVHISYGLIYFLGYDFLLLAILVLISPFIIRSKRNYKEGLLFSITVFFIVVVWSGWISLYFLLPDEHKDMIIAIGLNSTAMVLLLCVFIPRTYLMAAAIVRERTVCSLPSLNRNILSESVDNNFSSTQALNDTCFGTIVYKSSDAGLSNPNFTLGRSNTVREYLPDDTRVDTSPRTPRAKNNEPWK